MVEDSDHDVFNLNATEFLLEEALPNQNCENIRPSILKSFELTSNSDILPGFEKKQYLVKSYSRPNDYFVCVRDTGFTSCIITAQNTIKRDFVVIPFGQHSMQTHWKVCKSFIEMPRENGNSVSFTKYQRKPRS